MQKNTSLWLVIFAAIAVGAAFFFNIQDSFDGKGSKELINSAEISGIEVIHDGSHYTLGYEQQLLLLKYINQAVPTVPTKEKSVFSFEKIVIISLQGKSFEIIPLAIRSGDLVFSSPALGNGKPLRDTSAGKMVALIESSYSTKKS
jgi:hypothetical protein